MNLKGRSRKPAKTAEPSVLLEIVSVNTRGRDVSSKFKRTSTLITTLPLFGGRMICGGLAPQTQKIKDVNFILTSTYKRFGISNRILRLQY